MTATDRSAARIKCRLRAFARFETTPDPWGLGILLGLFAVALAWRLAGGRID